jgi:hypothetical protein
MDIDQKIKVAVIGTSLATICITVILFIVREKIDTVRKRRKAGRSLILYSNLAANAVIRDSGRALPIVMKDVIDSAQEILDIPSVPLLVAELERCSFAMQRVELTGNALDRNERNAFNASLRARMNQAASELKVVVPPAENELAKISA